MKPSDTVTMAHVADVLLGFFLDSCAAMEGAGADDFEFAQHAANCARSIGTRLGIEDLVSFTEQARAEGLIDEDAGEVLSGESIAF